MGGMTGESRSELFFVEPTSEDVKAAQEWLLGNRAEEPELWALAHTVNGYLRAWGPGQESNRWVEERLPRLGTKDSAGQFNTQELLDLLFLFCRKERFCEGTLDMLASEIGSILEVLRERVADTVSERLGS